MKKEKMITRTIESTEIFYKVFSTTDCAVHTVSTVLNGSFTVESAEKTLRDLFAKNECNDKFIMVDSVETKEELYGMPESVFMNYATKLPPRKIYATQETE